MSETFFLPENCLYCLNCRHHLTIFPAIISSLSCSVYFSLPHVINFSNFLLFLLIFHSRSTRHVKRRHALLHHKYFSICTRAAYVAIEMLPCDNAITSLMMNFSPPSTSRFSDKHKNSFRCKQTL